MAKRPTKLPLFRNATPENIARALASGAFLYVHREELTEDGQPERHKYPTPHIPGDVDESVVHGLGGAGRYYIEIRDDDKDEFIIGRMLVIPETIEEQKRRNVDAQSRVTAGTPPIQNVAPAQGGMLAISGLSPEMQLMWGMMQKSSSEARTDAQRFVDGYTATIERTLSAQRVPANATSSTEVDLLKKEVDRLRDTFAEEKTDLRKKHLAELDLQRKEFDVTRAGLDGEIRRLKDDADALRKRVIDEETRHREAEAAEAKRHFESEKNYLDEKLKLTRSANDATAKADKKELDVDFKKALFAAVADPATRSQVFEMAKGIFSHDPALYQLAMQQTLAENAAAQATAGAAVAAG